MANRTQSLDRLLVKPMVRKAVLVSRDAGRDHLIEGILDTDDYDVVFVESMSHAYSQIKRVAPSLVVVCLDMNDVEAFHMLSMLKFDRSTSHIPVVTCVSPLEATRFEDDTNEAAADLAPHFLPVSMN